MLRRFIDETQLHIVTPFLPLAFDAFGDIRLRSGTSMG